MQHRGARPRPGVPPYALERVFEKFYSLRRPDSGRKGTGLGLAICAWIAESHHGHIEVQSEPNKGSTFTVILPLAPPAS